MHLFGGVFFKGFGYLGDGPGSPPGVAPLVKHIVILCHPDLDRMDSAGFEVGAGI